MGRIIQVRDVPEESYRELKARAERENISLAELLRRELSGIARRPSRAEILDRLAEREAVHTVEDPVTTIRRMRDAS